MYSHCTEYCRGRVGEHKRPQGRETNYRLQEGSWCESRTNNQEPKKQDTIKMQTRQKELDRNVMTKESTRVWTDGMRAAKD